MVSITGHKGNVNQTMLTFHRIPVNMAVVKNTKQMLVMIWGKRNPHTLLVGI
jgi:hypothetical protein